MVPDAWVVHVLCVDCKWVSVQFWDQGPAVPVWETFDRGTLILAGRVDWDPLHPLTHRTPAV